MSRHRGKETRESVLAAAPDGYKKVVMQGPGRDSSRGSCQGARQVAGGPRRA